MNSPVAPAVSVLMPVYNCEPYLDEAIRSIRDQTITDFEFVIVNDGSTDGSLETIRRHAAEDPRIVVLDRPNGGIVDALNAGLAVCRGELVARMDGDDFASPSRLERQVTFLGTNPEVGVVGCAAVVVNELGVEIGSIDNPVGRSEATQLVLDGGYALLHPTIVVRAGLLRSLRGYDPDFRYAEDLDLLLRLAQVTRLANLPDKLLRYRRRRDSMSAARESIYPAWDLKAILKARSDGSVPSTTVARAFDRVSWSLLAEGNFRGALGAAANACAAAPFSAIGPRAIARAINNWFWTPREGDRRAHAS
ncbi:MAG: glycosyltransferase family 2 protein [Lacipirellulaceae bacterium]